MSFDETLAREAATDESCDDKSDEQGLVESFVQVCHFLYDNPERLSKTKPKKDKPEGAENVETLDGLKILARKYFNAYRKSDFPKSPTTIPDRMVSIVMIEAFDCSQERIAQVKLDHQYAMVAENCVGALLERYLDSVLRPYGWHWCCGSFVKAIDFIRRDANGLWLPLQIKNRDSSENSSSKAIRNDTAIQKWFRSFSKKEDTNWGNLPPLMQGYDLSEEGFSDFVRGYLAREKAKR